MLSHVPTLTDVLPSSSDALLPPPCLLLMLIRLELLPGWKIPLIGRMGGGEAEGELAMEPSSPQSRRLRLQVVFICWTVLRLLNEGA